MIWLYRFKNLCYFTVFYWNLVTIFDMFPIQNLSSCDITSELSYIWHVYIICWSYFPQQQRFWNLYHSIRGPEEPLGSINIPTFWSRDGVCWPILSFLSCDLSFFLPQFSIIIYSIVNEVWILVFLNLFWFTSLFKIRKFLWPLACIVLWPLYFMDFRELSNLLYIKYIPIYVNFCVRWWSVLELLMWITFVYF